MLTVVVEIARELGFGQVHVQCAKKNQHYNDDRAQALYLRYDVTARRCGFRWDDEIGRFVLNLR